MRQAEAHPVGLIIRLQRLTQPPGVTHSLSAWAAARILSGLSPADLDLLEPHLDVSIFPSIVPWKNRRIDHVYFIGAGFAGGR
jgi:hypothetical protein